MVKKTKNKRYSPELLGLVPLFLIVSSLESGNKSTPNGEHISYTLAPQLHQLS